MRPNTQHVYFPENLFSFLDFFFFFFLCFGLTGVKRDFGPLFFCRFSESGAAGLRRYCVGARRRRGTPTGPTLLLKTVLERGTVFFFFSFSCLFLPGANSIFLQNYTGQRGAKASFALRKAPGGTWEARICSHAIQLSNGSIPCGE